MLDERSEIDDDRRQIFFRLLVEPLPAPSIRDHLDRYSRAWGVFEDVASPGRMVETFYVESWFEHLRQHERVTKADRVIEKKIHALLTTAIRTTHLLSSQRR